MQTHPTEAQLQDARDRADIFIEARKIVYSLPVAHLLYAASEKRGEFRGFAALHDLFDANMMLPGAEDDHEDMAEWLDRSNKIMDKVTQLIIAHPICQLAK